MTHDNGFAPNPFHGFLTLACCKPGIRKNRKLKEEKDWIAGFTSVELNGDDIGKEKLVYLAKIDEKISFSEYWENYPEKKQNDNNLKGISGDNVYKPSNSKEAYNGFIFKGDKNHSHNHKKNWDKDQSGENVLISKEFYYFGGDPLTVPRIIRSKINIPKYDTYYGYRNDNPREFIDWVKEKIRERKPILKNIFGYPHDFKKSNKKFIKIC